jgi:hypothetical protein
MSRPVHRRLFATLLLSMLIGCGSLEQQVVWEGGAIPAGGAMTYSSMSDEGRWTARIETSRTVIEWGAVQVVLEGFGSRAGLDYHLRKDGTANITLVLPSERTVIWDGDVINVLGQVHDLTQPGRYTFDPTGALRFEQEDADGG